MSTASQPIYDLLVREGAESRVIDLKAAFGADATGFAVQNSDGQVVTGATIDDDGLLTVDFGALGHSDIRVTATTATGEVEDHFRVRVAGENAYTIAVLPDTQDYTTSAAGAATFEAMTQWLVDNKDAHNIQFAIHVGDITANNQGSDWLRASKALSILDGKIPYSLLPGNHDQASGGTAANHSSDFLDLLYAPYRRADDPSFGGAYDQEPDRAANTYSKFTAPDGTNWLVLSLEFGPRDDVIRWAGEVIEQHLDHRVIVASHSLTNWDGRHDPTGAPLYGEGTGADYGMRNSPEGANDGETVYRELVAKYPNVTFTFSGHIFGDGAETVTSYSQHGNPTFEMLVNYQWGVATEINSNGGQGYAAPSGNGAIRLVVIDPENGRVDTQTYFVELDQYLSGFRDKEELDRDGLTGPYRGHQETIENVDLGAPELRAIAKAGNDLFVNAEAQAAEAEVTLDGSRSLNPGEAELTYRWLDADGMEVATGATPTLTLGAGHHLLTLEVTEATGQVTHDEVLVIVSTDRTLLTDNFNDADLGGWGRPGATFVSYGTPESFGLPSLEGGSDTVMQLPKLAPNQTLKVTPNLGLPDGTLISEYSLVFDILVPAGSGGWTSFLQTDLSNASDGELFLRSNGDGTGGIGISSVYEGAFQYGQWQRVAFVFEDNGNGTVTLHKYIEGEKVGAQSLSGDRFKIDAGGGFLLFSDNDGETTQLYVNNVLVTDKVFSEAEIAGLGGATAGPILDSAPTPTSVQFSFDGMMNPGFGEASLGLRDGNAGGNFILKGSAFARSTTADGQAAPEARVHDQSDAAGNVLIWNDPVAKGWSDYVYELTLKTSDNDQIGVVAYFQDDDNHYRVVLEGENNTRSIVKVVDGVQTVLAQVDAGTPFNVDMHLKVVVQDGSLQVFLDGQDVFGGPVIDESPLTGGTVGFWSSNQRTSEFDNVAVNPVTLTAHAGSTVKAADTDASGDVAVTLTGAGSYGPDEIVSWTWSDADGNLLGEGRTLDLMLPPTRQVVTLTVTDAGGGTATHKVVVQGADEGQVLAFDDFSNGWQHWTVVDEGEFGGTGPDGLGSDWRLEDERLVQHSDLQSRQLTWNGASNADVWQRGWSPLGDGVNVLRKGTYTLYDKAEAYGWSNYAVEATISTPDNQALGFLFYYTDANNYYKLELDANGDYDRNASNGAGSLFQLIQVKDGIEDAIVRFPAKYSVGEEFHLRVEVLDGKIQAFLDGQALFAYAIEDHAHAKGTVALYSWGSEGVSFDEVTVTSLVPSDAGKTLYGTAGDDRLFGGSGADTILAGTGDDTVLGGRGSDSLRGGEGDDRLAGDAGRDTLSGGNGNDTLSGGDHDDLLLGGQGNDRQLGGNGNDLLRGALGNDTLLGGWGEDTLQGGQGDDRLVGEAGDDRLMGFTSEDTLVGGEGRDTLAGGDGDDVLTGGAGADLFVFGLGSGRDLITDLEAHDRIDLRAWGFEGFDDLTIGGSGRRLVVELSEDDQVTVVLNPGVVLTEDHFIFG